MFGDYPEEYGEVMTEYSQEDDRRTQRDVGEVPRRGACGSRIAYCRLRCGEVFVRRCEVQTVHENANVLEDEVQSVGDELHCSRTLNFIIPRPFPFASVGFENFSKSASILLC